MVRRRNVRRRRRGRRVARRSFGRVRLMNGGMIRGRMHPPSNSASPWNNCVVTFQWIPTPPDSGKNFVPLQNLTAKDVRTQLSAELGLSGSVDMRIFRVDVWTQPQISNSNRNTVVIAPVDWTRCDGAVLNWYESWGTAVQPAHGHYIWPRSISNVVIPDTKQCAVVKFDVRDTGFAFIVKFHLVWRKSQPDPLREITGISRSLRGPRAQEPPPPDDYEVITEETAMSPLVRVVDACTLRT